nr:hypothetical protein L203_03568 [Cryptococcus depauperatus CBS 7841]
MKPERLEEYKKRLVHGSVWLEALGALREAHVVDDGQYARELRSESCWVGEWPRMVDRGGWGVLNGGLESPSAGLFPETDDA